MATTFEDVLVNEEAYFVKFIFFVAQHSPGNETSVNSFVGECFDWNVAKTVKLVIVDYDD